jgi:hypothetical protein
MEHRHFRFGLATGKTNHCPNAAAAVSWKTRRISDPSEFGSPARWIIKI